MTNEEAIIKLNWALDNNAIEDILSAYDFIVALNMAIDALKLNQKWIPVTERTPKEEETVIVSGKYNVYPEARFTKEYGWEWAYEAGTGYWTSIIEPVEAWMPLPKPYKPESEE